jgi:hypothetical protein
MYLAWLDCAGQAASSIDHTTHSFAHATMPIGTLHMQHFTVYVHLMMQPYVHEQSSMMAQPPLIDWRNPVVCHHTCVADRPPTG